MSRIGKIAASVVVVLIVVAAVILVVTGTKTKKATVYFARATGLYEGSNVRVLGIPVGKVQQVLPEGTRVRVDITYDAKYRIPANASAAIIPPSLVADRYVQLLPAYNGGPVMPDNAVIPLERTQVPVELSTLLQSVDDLSVALGPNGANKDGALSRLLVVSARNLEGNGQQINSTVHDVATLVSALADNKDNLNSTVDHLATFTNALLNSDAQVRELTQNLATVSQELEQDRSDLSAALHNLSIALGQVAGFVHDNRAILTTDVTNLNKVLNLLVSQKNSLIEALDDGPLALQNLNNAYDPQTQALRTKNNFEQFINPQLYLCQILASFTNNANVCATGPLGDVLSALANAVTGVIGTGGGGSSAASPLAKPVTPTLPNVLPSNPVTGGH